MIYLTRGRDRRDGGGNRETENWRLCKERVGARAWQPRREQAPGTGVLAWNPTCDTAMWHLDKSCCRAGLKIGHTISVMPADSPSQLVLGGHGYPS